MLTTPQATLISATLLSFWGCINSLYGYRWFRFVLAVFGALMGAVGGVGFWFYLLPGETVWLPVCAVVAAILGAVLAWWFVVFWLFVFGAMMAAMITLVTVASFMGNSSWTIEVTLGAAACAAIIGGTLLVWLRRPLITVMTALNGGFSIALAFVFFLNPDEAFVDGRRWEPLRAVLDRHSWVPLVGLVLAGIGAIFQWHDQRSPGDEDSKPKKKKKK